MCQCHLERQLKLSPQVGSTSLLVWSALTDFACLHSHAHYLTSQTDKDTSYFTGGNLVWHLESYLQSFQPLGYHLVRAMW